MNNNPYHQSVDTTPYYRAYLCKSLSGNQAVASESVNSADVSTALETFDRLSKFGSGEMALEVALATINMKSVLSDAAGYIARELEKLPKNKTVEGNSILRLREIYKKLNSDIKKCQITIGGIDYSKEAIEQATVKLSPALQDKWDYSLNTATGSIQEKLVLEVCGVR